MRILLASNVYPPNFIGGAEIIAHQQAKALKALGHEVMVFAGESHPFGERYQCRQDVFEGIPVHRISLEPRDFDARFVNFAHREVEFQFVSVLEQFRPEVFHGHNLIGLSSALPYLARQAGAACLVTLHDHWGYCHKNTIIKSGTSICDDFSRCYECLPFVDDGDSRAIPIRLRKDHIALMLSVVDAFVSPSQFLAGSYLKAGYPADRMHVVWNGIDLERFQKVVRNEANGRLRLTYVGILAPHKGVLTLVGSLGHLPSDAPITLNIVGGGELRQACEELANQIGRSHWVKFWGRVDNESIEKVYEDTDVLILPSVWPENQPVSICEAMACSIPAIVSRIGGMPELVAPGESGDCFDPGNEVDLARVIAIYLDDPTRAARFGKKACQRIEAYSLDVQVAKLLHLYARAQEKPRPLETADRLAACLGTRIPVQAAEAIEIAGAKGGWTIVMDEWLPPELASKTNVKWLVDPEADWNKVAPALSARAARLIDVRNVQARWALWKVRGALYYYDAAQATDALSLLDEEPELREQLAENAYQDPDS